MIAIWLLDACATTPVSGATGAVLDPAAATSSVDVTTATKSAPQSPTSMAPVDDPHGTPQSEASTPNAPPQQSTEASHEKDAPDMFTDPKDGYFDASRFLDSRRGFLPFAMPITEPAVGYGAAAALVFFEAPPRAIQTASGTRVIPPNTTMVGGFATENGSWGALAAHLHTWDEGRYRYIVAAGYASLNLDWFGRSDEFEGKSFSYNLEGTVIYQKFTTKIGDSDFFAGPIQRLLVTKTSFDNAQSLPPIGISNDEENTTVSGLGLALAYDTRNSYFSPTRGTKAILNYTQQDELIGSDFDYGRGEFEVCQYVPLEQPFALGLRSDVQYASNNAPFFDLAAVNLRGIPAGRYVDNVALTLESELRWDLTQRWTVVGFGGAGWSASDVPDIDTGEGHWAGGAGFRYLLAREYDMRVGCDLAYGPDGVVFYVTIGTGWLRD